MTTKPIKTRNIVIAILVAIVAIFFIGWYIGAKKAKSAAQATIDANKGVITRYEIKLDSTKLYVAEITQELKTLRQAKQDGDVTNEELRKLKIKNLNEITRLNLVIDTLLTHVVHNGEIIDILDSQIVNYKSANDSITKRKAILLPFTFGKSDQWLNLNGTFNSQGVLDVSLKVNALLNVYTGISKQTKKPFAEVTSNNPYLGVLSINSIKMDKPKIKYYGIGLNIGYGLSKDFKLTPYLGVGLSYNFIRF